jgi:uncharacterized protein (DUF433 family)
MSLLATSRPVPLVTDVDGVVRVGSTRVTLDKVVACFREGITAEAIVDQYPSVRLADVHLVLGHFLGHQAEVDAYLHERQKLAAETRRGNEDRFDPAGVRDRLLARRNQG